MAKKPPPEKPAADDAAQLHLFEQTQNTGAQRVAAKLGIPPAELAQRVGLADCQAIANGGGKRRRQRKGFVAGTGFNEHTGKRIDRRQG
jgi:hypothetical protein